MFVHPRRPLEGDVLRMLCFSVERISPRDGFCTLRGLPRRRRLPDTRLRWAVPQEHAPQ